MAQMVKNRPAMQETQVQPLGQEDPLEKGVATHSSFLAWRIPWREELGGLQSIGSVQSLSHVRLFATEWIAAHHASLFITNSRSLPKLMSIELVMPSNHLILCHLLLLLPSTFPNIRVFSMSQLSASGGQNIGVLDSLSLLPMNTWSWSPLGGTGPRDSQESSPTPQFKSISSLALSFLHSPTLTSINDHWKNHSLD